MGLAVALAVAALLVAAYAISRLRNALDQVKQGNDALASRLSELQTLHAMGRELLATLDPERIVEIVERECRKIYPVDTFFLGRCGREAHGIEGGATAPLGDPLAAWILRDKRALRIDDAGAAPEGILRPPMTHGATGSVIAVPLLIGERAVGVLSVHSARLGAFDDHQLSLLGTIAQQAATALDTADHYAAQTQDALTGLTLRDEFLRRLDDEYVRSRRRPRAFSVLMLDLDGFKDVNERQGHAAGDRYLRELGASIRGRLRASDVGCRYGGDEIGLLLPETEIDGAGRLAERLRQAVARLVVDVDGTPVRATASIGIASFPAHDAGTPKGLLLRAEQAVHKAKRDGRNRVA